MNLALLTGRLTKDPEYKAGEGGKASVAKFTVAIDRPVRQGREKETDFPRVTVFGKQADNCNTYLKKGRLVNVQGRIQTGSYKDKDGKTVYTTDIIAERVEFLEWGNQQKDVPQQAEIPAVADDQFDDINY